MNRSIPVPTVVALTLTNYWIKLGTIAFLVTSLLTLPIIKETDLSFYDFMTNEVVKTPGTIIRARITSTTFINTNITKTDFTFVTKDNQKHEGSSYNLGEHAKPGDKVTVEYPKSKPKRARIEGYHGNIYGPFALAWLLFPTLALLAIAIGIKKLLSTIELLRMGHVSEAIYRKMRATSLKVNGRGSSSREATKRVYRLEYEFETKKGETYHASFTTPYPEGKTDQDRSYQLVYDPTDPTKNYILAALKGNLHINEDGQFEGKTVLGLDGGKAKDLLVIAVIYLVIRYIVSHLT